MRVAAISDLHIGTSARTDGFRHPTRAFLRFLDELERTHDRIVLLGDIWQTDHGAMPGPRARARALHAARGRVGVVTERFSASPYVYVHGNHDEIAAHELGAATSHAVPGVFPALFIHGHQFDPVALAAPRLADLGTWTCGRLRAAGLRPVAAWLEGRDVAVKDQRFRGTEGPYARAAGRLARDHAAPIVVMGHTHVPSVTPIAEGLAVNTGTCSDGRRMWASIDTETGAVVVHGPSGPCARSLAH
jgi:UDP-2,3-diacylglucosamine pyrophosphatase LpxH